MSRDIYEIAEKKIKQAAEANIDILESIDILNLQYASSTEKITAFKKMLKDQIADVTRCKNDKDYYYLLNRKE